MSLVVILDFNRKFSDHKVSSSSLFGGSENRRENSELLKEKQGRGDYPIGILERWNAGIMGLDFYFGLQIAE